MAETWWSAAPLGLDPEVDAVPAVLGLARGLVASGVDAPVGLLLCVLTPGLDGQAVRAGLEAALPGAPVLVLQAAAAVVGGEVVRRGAGVLLGQWAGAPAQLGRAAAPGDGLRFAEAGAPRAPAFAGAGGAGLTEPMGPGGPLWLSLPALRAGAVRVERGAEPVGPRLRASGVHDGQIDALDGERAATTLARVGAGLPPAGRERLRARPLLLPAGGPAWAVGALGPPARILGVHEGSGALLVDRAVPEGAAVQLGASRPRALAEQLGVRPLPPGAPRLALLIGAPAPDDEALIDDLAALQLRLGPTLLFGLQAEEQLASGQALSGCDVLAVFFEADWS